MSPNNIGFRITPEQLRKARKLFEASPDDGRPLAIDLVADEELGDLVNRMMVANGQEHAILDHPLTIPVPEPILDGEILRPGDVLDRYVIVRQIGVGGMGTVYQARVLKGAEPFVAIKVLRWSSHDFSKRFQREERILSALRHPNIARLLDSGVTSDNSPYLVMEYVEGEPIHAFCERKALAIDHRLQLFQRLCEAVQYLHQNLIVHRDLKPSNILVAADGAVKLVDFGIAKLLQAGDSFGTSFATSTGLMTPDYASPEQVRGLPTSTLTDVYSLGILLYELLSGTQPFAVGEAEIHEVLRRICEDEPAKPSVAALRNCSDRRTGRRQARKLRGELDNIVLKAIRKEPERRYASVEQLDDDVSRYLTSKPVLAQGDSLAYEVRKFVHRNRSGVLASGIMLLLLVCGFVATSIEARIASRERQRAEEQAREAEQQRIRAEEQTRIAEQQRTIAERQRADAQAMEAQAERRLQELQTLAKGAVQLYTATNESGGTRSTGALITQNAQNSLSMLQRERTLTPELAGVADSILADIDSSQLARDSSWHVPSGWNAYQTKPHEYRVGVDHKVVHSGKSSVFVRSLLSSPTGNVSVSQAFDAARYRAKRVRVTASLRSSKLSQSGSLWVRIADTSGNTTVNDSAIVSGTSGWNQYQLVVDVPNDSESIQFGVLLTGTGTLWADDFSFGIVGKSTALTRPDQPSNLDFTKRTP